MLTGIKRKTKPAQLLPDQRQQLTRIFLYKHLYNMII